MLAPLSALAADSSPAPAAVGDWLKTFFWLAGGCAALGHLWSKLSPSRHPPLDAELESIRGRIDKTIALCRDTCRAEYAANLQAVENRVAAVEADIVVQTKALNDAGEARCSKIHRRIDALVKPIYLIAGRLDVKIPSED